MDVDRRGSRCAACRRRRRAPPRCRRASRPRRRRPRQPQAARRGRPAPARSPRRRLRRATTAAYEAFDQGKYLTALELALKAAAQRRSAGAHAGGPHLCRTGSAPRRIWRRPPSGTRAAPSSAMPRRCSAVAVMLAEGQGVQKDRAEAARLFEMAAAHKHPLANYNLALLFLTGDGKPENPYRAAMHMRFAAESGVVGGAVRPRHAVCDRHRRRAQRPRGRQMDRQGCRSRAPRGAGRLRRHAVPRPGRARSTRSAAPSCSAPPRRRGSPRRRSASRAAWRRVLACRPTSSMPPSGI